MNLTILIIICLFLLVVFTGDVEALSCACATGLPDCTYSGECGASRIGYLDTWSCMIVKQDCGCPYVCYTSNQAAQ
jgi:hypothetical protein